MGTETIVAIHTEGDIVSARQEGRRRAEQLGFSETDRTLIATAISEVARNIILYAGSGEILIRIEQESGKQSIVIIASDEGPGIPKIEDAMQDGYSTGKGLGLGLPGTKRLMDEFSVTSEVGKGTTVFMKKWK